MFVIDNYPNPSLYLWTRLGVALTEKRGRVRFTLTNQQAYSNNYDYSELNSTFDLLLQYSHNTKASVLSILVLYALVF